MPSPRLAVFTVLVLAACAAWESASPTYSAPPADGPAPSSRYAPPPAPPPAEPPVGDPSDPPAAPRMAIASVQLLADCPDPVEAPAAESSRQSSSQGRSSQEGARAKVAAGAAPACEQSTVQLTVNSGAAGRLRIEAVRVLAAPSKGVAGSSTLRGPRLWTAEGTYAAWDEQVEAEKALQISYKLGELDLSRASELKDPEFSSYAGPFLLELDVSIDGRRQTLRSPEFRRQPIEVMMT